MAYEIVNSRRLAHGKIMDLYQDALTMPNGKTAMREYVVKGNAAAVVPLTADGRVLMVRQYRHPLRQMLLEIPAGVVEPGEEPAVCARRELEEETGKKCGRLDFLCTMYVSAGVSNEAVSVYVARELSPGMQHLDPDEFWTVEEYALEELIERIFAGEITDGKTIAGILACRELLRREAGQA